MLADAGCIAAVAAAGGLDVLVRYAARTPAHSAAVLLAARAFLGAANTIVLLGAQVERRHQRRSENRPAEEPRPGVDWTTVPEEMYLEILEVAGQWRSVVFAVLAQALFALDEPEARHPSPAVLRAILALAESNGLSDESGDDTTGHIERLLFKQRDPEGVRAACRWVRRLDLETGSADLARAELVRKADDRRNGRHAEIHVLRNDLAERHAQLAQNTALADDQRIEHLHAALKLHPASARSAAVPLAQSASPDIRLAAARILAETPGSPEEHATLAGLVAAEDHAEVAAQLQMALHRLASGDTGEALHNLAELLGLPTRDLAPDVLIPEAPLRARFSVWVDRARARAASTHDPSTFIDAAISIADQMVDLALIARADAGQRVALKPDQVEALRVNAPNRLDVGFLVVQQQNVQQFQWFSLVAALREKRAAHPSRLGSTAPPRFDADDLVAARRLLRDITVGWMGDMQESAQLRAASPEPA